MDSRQRILEHMKRSGEAAVAELSRALRLTPVTIRHHLEALQSERLLEAPQARRKTGPGRPEMVYRLSPGADRSMPPKYGEREGGDLKLTLANCPYLEAARATPALCLFDLGLLQSLFGRPVRMAGRIVQQAPVCTFYVEDGPLARLRARTRGGWSA